MVFIDPFYLREEINLCSCVLEFKLQDDERVLTRLVEGHRNTTITMAPQKISGCTGTATALITGFLFRAVL